MTQKTDIETGREAKKKKSGAANVGVILRDLRDSLFPRQLKEGEVIEREERSWVQAHLPQLLTAPAFVIPTLLIGVQIIGNFYALTDFDFRFGVQNYLGLGNFIYLFTKDKEFISSLIVTLKYAITALAVELPVGFIVSLLLDRITGPFEKIARAIVILPMSFAPVIATMMWKIMLGPTQGVFNYLLMEFAGLKKPIDWLGDKNVVLFSLVMIDAWIYIPFVITVFWGGWKTLPKAPYEAAQLDGASAWFIFRKLTLPLLRPFLMIVLLFRTCDTLNMFDAIFVSTRGGPAGASQTLNLLAYDQALRWDHFGYGVAVIIVQYFVVYAISKRLMQFWPR